MIRVKVESETNLPNSLFAHDPREQITKIVGYYRSITINQVLFGVAC